MTTLPNLSWEQKLLSLARQADGPSVQISTSALADRLTLARAYAHCSSITSVHSRSFFLATRLLPFEKRRAVRALYAFSRRSDDIVDRATGDAAEVLRKWRYEVLQEKATGEDLIILAWADARHRFQIPHKYVEQLIDGVGQDLYKKRYETFDELAAYAYGVASTVGLMSMQIIGYHGEMAVPYAIKLGVALQLTNILRDVGEDWQAGRIYLPLKEMNDFGLSEGDLDFGLVNGRWRAFMKFQIERNRRLYKEAWPGLKLLHKDGQLSVAAAAAFYRAILDDIEDHDYDVFNRRSFVSGWRKIQMIPGLWWSSWQDS